jgi:hypothetical protein
LLSDAGFVFEFVELRVEAARERVFRCAATSDREDRPAGAVLEQRCEADVCSNTNEYEPDDPGGVLEALWSWSARIARRARTEQRRRG